MRKYFFDNELIELIHSFESKRLDIVNDGMNSGFEVEFCDEIKKYYINYDEVNISVLKKPHITTSIAIGASGMNTKNLKFIPLKKPKKIVGRFGYWIKDGNNEYLSFDPFFDKVKS